MTGPQDPAAGGDRLRAGHADREQVIEALKDAFVQGRLDQDELDARVGQALTARTRADLAALTADIPPAPVAARPAAARPAAVRAAAARPGAARPPAPARRRPLARAAAGSGGCLVIAAAAMRVAFLADPGATPGPIPKALAVPCLVVAFSAVVAAVLILVFGAAVAVEQRRSHRPPLPPPGPVHPSAASSGAWMSDSLWVRWFASDQGLLAAGDDQAAVRGARGCGSALARPGSHLPGPARPARPRRCLTRRRPGGPVPRPGPSGWRPARWPGRRGRPGR